MGGNEFLDALAQRTERGRASDRAVAKAAGVTVAELDQDTTRPDDRRTGRPNEFDRYLVQFRKIGKLDFKTDCAFRDGQLDAARGYVIRVLSTLCATVAAGRVLDADTDTVVYQNSNQPGSVAWSAGLGL